MAFRLGMVFVAAATAAALLVPAAAGATGDAVRGQKLAYTCLGCHGIENYKNAYPNYSVPRLGGQSEVYIVAALKEYQSKARWHPTMQGQAAQMSEKDMADLGAYFQGPKRATSDGKVVGTPPPAAAICAACHGPDGNGVTPDYPSLAGQHADYIEQSLHGYRSGKRQNAIMAGFAPQLKPEEIKALAAFFSKQKGVYTTRKP
ncbi:MAG: c-type cytochrome [Steroidobacteraceae bacterium]|nr:c-type cytochrome [Steroidobacteraceae bacterium]MCC7198767.1 c-type cytochrome [Gammaproteobacteria bacterium]